ncbi:uncharacterized protein LOC112344158 [Selaginella moellendorffii]|uniref:uncharacterized protein LOC112344158 n=1 Tax=Selaginella moellendorffii TaxID=88036 RepID=UPI000D1C27AA|nr:uncharacterized protein LOC112344158 [Selaginella moellendorffii]|eukprot:XP_024524196.1 uncharacterized protein LOC112344158 [Selaginella moellendorffii]
MSQPLRCPADFPELLWKDCQAKSNELCDVEIVVGTRNFWCHGSILAASSEFFRSAYNPSASGVKIIRLSSIPGGPHVFELVRRFLYGQDFTVTDATVLDVWQAADFLGITPRKPDGVSLQARCKSVWDSRVQHSWRSCLHLLCKAAKLGSITDVHPSDGRLAECKKRFLLLVGSHLAMGAVLRNLVKLKAGHVEQVLSILKDVPVVVPAAELSQNMMAYLMDLVCYFKAGSPPSDKVGANIISVCEFVLDYLQCATGAYRRAPGSFFRSGTGQAPAVIYLAMVAHTCYVLNPGRYARSNFDTVLTLVGPLDIGCLTPEALAEWVQPFFPTSETGFPVRSKIGELLGHYVTSTLEENPPAISWFFFHAMANFASKACESHDQLYDLIKAYMKKNPQTSEGLKQAFESMLDLGKVSAVKAGGIACCNSPFLLSSRFKDAVSNKWSSEFGRQKLRKRLFDELSPYDDDDDEMTPFECSSN